MDIFWNSMMLQPGYWFQNIEIIMAVFVFSLQLQLIAESLASIVF